MNWDTAWGLQLNCKLEDGDKESTEEKHRVKDFVSGIEQF